jgi:hypothetical protein
VFSFQIVKVLIDRKIQTLNAYVTKGGIYCPAFCVLRIELLVIDVSDSLKEMFTFGE